ncbi:MAG: hypothetical protein K9H61_06675 [Bacteroidia bacterium]|nr:hypothetical protein [Bacteroidia bacterium]MCF8425117.1 hypothetical protein [Bacteroidia bacterium]MCF8446662.1 hypothetical protein [Bacteroidia bacterium]
MRTIEIRQRLIEEISTSTNKNLLEAMYKFFSNDNATEKVYNLSNAQKMAIEKGREQIKNGQSLTNEEVNSEIEKWLKEK